MVSTSESRLVAKSSGPPAPAMTARRPSARAIDHAGVAVVDVQPVVVGGHQQRAPGIPLRPRRLAGLFGNPLLNLPIPVPHPVRAFPVCAQQPVLIQRRQRDIVGAVQRCLAQPQRMRQQDRTQSIRRIVGFDELDVFAAGMQQLQRTVGVTDSDRLGKTAD